MLDMSSTKKTENTTTENTTQDLTSSNVDNLSSLDKTTVADAEGSVFSHIHGATISSFTTADGVVEGANEATLAALDNNTLLAADSTGKLLDANSNVTALAGQNSDNLTALAGVSLDNVTALAGQANNNVTALAGQVVSSANAAAGASNNATALAGKTNDNITALAGQNSDNLTALSGLIVENSNNSTETFASFATGANDNVTALAGTGFDALNINNEQSLAVLNSVATEALHTANVGMGAIKDTAGMGFTTAQNIATHGLDKLGDNSTIAITALSNESSESKTALTTVSGYALATAEKQFDTAITELGMSNRSAQADMVSIAGQSADLMSETLGNVLTNGQVSMQKTSNEGMKIIGWVAGAAVVAIILLSVVKKG